MDKNEEFLDALMDFATGLEAALAQLKKNLYDLAQKQNDAKPLWDPCNVKWEKASSEKGEYEKATTEANNGNKDFENMVGDIKAHGGKIRRGDCFYWVFEYADKPTVGRKPIKKVSK